VKIAVAKPDYGFTGGFELVVQRIVDGLAARGHQVDYARVDATGSEISHLPLPVEPKQRELFREFFFHLNMVARFEALDLSAYDAVLCTQPCSYAVRHPRRVLLFYHHTRAFYDLQAVMLDVRDHDVELYHYATSIVRDIDRVFLTRDIPILAGSRRVKQRLAEYNGLFDNVEVFNAGLDEALLADTSPVTFEQPITVGRHEFPKRVELFLHAMHHVRGLEGRILGAGHFTERLKGLDAWLRLRHRGPVGAASGSGSCGLRDEILWRHHTIHMPEAELQEAVAAVAASGDALPSRFLGRTGGEDLLREYRAALCVVCPALDEDFGLTCLEAMACGKPVIACHDGGGYVELIDNGVDGLLVEPDARAIAGAIERLTDRDLARTMGARGREKARTFTWPRAIDQVERALART
jgi:glycosyltransferase involved in cell wall biosynthesis